VHDDRAPKPRILLEAGFVDVSPGAPDNGLTCRSSRFPFVVLNVGGEAMGLAAQF
jgi:hypothetical protein